MEIKQKKALNISVEMPNDIIILRHLFGNAIHIEPENIPTFIEAVKEVSGVGEIDNTVLSEEILVDKMGFERLPHFTVGNALIYKLDRNRHLSVGSVGTPNETLFICESDKDDYRKITDLVCLHNYDYNGYLSKSKLESLIELLTKHK